MPEVHKVGRYSGGDIPPSHSNPIYAQWLTANQATNQGTVVDLAELCFHHSSSRRAEAGSGASHGTCFAVAEVFDATRGVLLYMYGDSALHLSLHEDGSYTTTTGKSVNTLRGHAEISALAQAINTVVFPDSDYANCFVARLYIELSPCHHCAKQLEPYTANTVLMYSYDHGDSAEMDRWTSDNQAGMHAAGGKVPIPRIKK